MTDDKTGRFRALNDQLRTTGNGGRLVVTKGHAALPGHTVTAIFLAAQLAVEHVFNYRTSVGILVNLVCGSYFLALMVRGRGRA